jgi:tRNA threonylcarbamoyl adenosine modification protein YeaZ
MIARIALDASLRVPSCAVMSARGLFAATGTGHPTESFSEVIRECLELAKLEIDEIDEVLACVGPGSYMGVRAAVATANALGLGLDRGVTGVFSVDALALSAPPGTRTVALPAGRGRWFAANHEWREGMLVRLGDPYVTDTLPDGAWEGSAPIRSVVDPAAVDARAVIGIAREQRHLAIETMRTEVTPYLLNTTPRAL